MCNLQTRVTESVAFFTSFSKLNAYVFPNTKVLERTTYIG